MFLAHDLSNYLIRMLVRITNVSNESFYFLDYVPKCHLRNKKISEENFTR